MSEDTAPVREPKVLGNDKYLVEDEKESRKLWKEAHGGLRGFQKAWNSKFINVADPLSKLQKRRMKDKGVKKPALVDNKGVNRAPEPNAYSIGRTAEGWVVMEYHIEDFNCTLISCSKPEQKHFAVNRIQSRIMEQMQ